MEPYKTLIMSAVEPWVERGGEGKQVLNQEPTDVLITYCLQIPLVDNRQDHFAIKGKMWVWHEELWKRR